RALGDLIDLCAVVAELGEGFGRDPQELRTGALAVTPTNRSFSHGLTIVIGHAPGRQAQPQSLPQRTRRGLSIMSRWSVASSTPSARSRGRMFVARCSMCQFGVATARHDGGVTRLKKAASCESTS